MIVRDLEMNQIEVNPRVCNGKPVIAGTRIPVTVILDQFASGCSLADVQRKYPELTRDQIASALRYCHAMIDHSDLQAVTA
ncbi:MAG: antitoxin [Lentisphaerae bacterium RIFOXYB12_FULL_65_16]|nr:MAG: antitoxin [Lentisphaerae bacterium RIFOXYA12_64_32]OGV89012.1 MAG: antitoxin [Lentisphaerae bacterium RIFOXYB12_FULL_65_16]